MKTIENAFWLAFAAALWIFRLYLTGNAAWLLAQGKPLVALAFVAILASCTLAEPPD